MRFNEPERFINAARDLCEQVGGASVVEVVSFVDGQANVVAKGGQRLRDGLHMSGALGDIEGVFLEA